MQSCETGGRGSSVQCMRFRDCIFRLCILTDTQLPNASVRMGRIEQVGVLQCVGVVLLDEEPRCTSSCRVEPESVTGMLET